MAEAPPPSPAALVPSLKSRARGARSVPEALSYLQECDSTGIQITLILLDLDFDSPDDNQLPDAPAIEQASYPAPPPHPLVLVWPKRPPRTHPRSIILFLACVPRIPRPADPHRCLRVATVCAWPRLSLRLLPARPSTSVSSRSSRSSPILRTRSSITPFRREPWGWYAPHVRKKP